VCVAKDIDRQLKICTSYLVYSQIWLNLPMDDGHFFLPLPIDDHDFSYMAKLKKKKKKKNPAGTE
jgi:hypothetical protein